MKTPKYPEAARAYRAARGEKLSQARLAARVGVTSRTIMRIENGQNRPEPALRDRIARELDVDPDTLPAYERVAPPFLETSATSESGS